MGYHYGRISLFTYTLMIQPRTQTSLAYRIATLAAGSMLAAVGFFGTAHFAHAAALTSTNVQPASLVAGSSTTVTVTFTTASALPNNGKIKVTFPSGFDTSTVSAPVSCTGFDGSFTFGTAGNVVAINRSANGTSTGAPATITCTLPTIRNPQVSGSTGTYTITTTDSSNVTIDTDAAVAADTITAAALTGTNVQPSVSTVGITVTATATFTSVNPVPSTGKIKITFPSGYNVAGANGGACSTMDGAFTTSVASQVVTLTRSGGTSAAAGAHTCTINGIINPTTVATSGTYTISTSNSSDAVIDTNAAVTGDTFTGRKTTVVDVVPLTYDIQISMPEAADVYMPGDDIAIQWSTAAGTGSVSAVNLDYSVDGGANWIAIAHATANDGSYTWTAPSIIEQSVTIRAQATDLVTTLDSDESDAFSIGTADDETADDTSTDTSTDTTSTDETTTPAAMLLPVGTLIKGASWSTVYYVDYNNVRRPFLDTQTFYTYASSFDAVIDVEDSYLANFTIGAPMLPMAGTVLVKIDSVNKVYALGDEGELHWITSESLASSLYGSNWADYVIDVPVTAWSHFTIGDDISSTSDWTVDTDLLQTRDELNSK